MAHDGASMPNRAWSILAYSGARIGLFLGIWIVLAWLSPIKGLLAAALALVLSGAISMLALNRQRDAMSKSIAGFFGRMNARIDASTRAEDQD